jgi:hypothetical protein
MLYEIFLIIDHAKQTLTDQVRPFETTKAVSGRPWGFVEKVIVGFVSSFGAYSA